MKNALVGDEMKLDCRRFNECMCERERDIERERASEFSR